MSYVDGFVCAVPTQRQQEFRLHAERSAAVFKEHGALRVVECWGDNVPDGELTSFPKAVQKKEDETICFSWIVWPSKEERDAGMEKVLRDERMSPEDNPMPFDGKRLIYGSFTTLVDV